MKTKQIEFTDEELKVIREDVESTFHTLDEWLPMAKPTSEERMEREINEQRTREDIIKKIGGNKWD